MTPQQRAVLAKAKKDGLKPSEQASEFMLHDVVEACIQQMKNYSVAWKNLSEKEQDASISSLTDSLKETVTDAIQIIISAGAAAIPFKLKKLSIDGKLTVTGLVEGDHPQRHALTDKAHDKSEILLILSPRDYFEGLDTIKGEKDQKSLSLDPDVVPAIEKPENKASEKATKRKSTGVSSPSVATFKPEDLDKAKTFLDKFRTPTQAGIQNHLSCGFKKAEAILAELCSQGEVIRSDDGTYSMPPLNTSVAEDRDDAPSETGNEAGAKLVATLTDDLYEQIKAKVIKDQRVSAGGLSIAFDADESVIAQAIDRMEMETVISEEDEMGGREVYDTE